MFQFITKWKLVPSRTNGAPLCSKRFDCYVTAFCCKFLVMVGFSYLCSFISYRLSSSVNQFQTRYFTTVVHYSCHQWNPLSTVTKPLKFISGFCTPFFTQKRSTVFRIRNKETLNGVGWMCWFNMRMHFGQHWFQTAPWGCHGKGNRLCSKPHGNPEWSP